MGFPKICDSACGHCVPYGISIMRAALGYTPAAIEFSDDDDFGTKDIVERLTNWFPEHAVKFWTPQGKDLPGYAGDNYISDGSPTRLVAFTYFPNLESAGHFVIGEPAIYPGMISSLVFTVEEK